MKKILQNSLKFIIPVFIGAGILWYLYKEQDMSKIRNVLDSGVDWKWILLSLFFSILSHVMRAYRWKLQFKTLGITPSLHDLTNSVFGNYGVNLIFPRLGEVWRCNFMAKRHNLPFTTVLGTMISERLFDVMCIALISIVTFFLQRKIFFSFFSEHPTLAGTMGDIFLSPWLYLVILTSGAAAYFFRKRVMRLAIAQKITGLCRKLWEGVETIRLMKYKWTFILLTFGIWTLYFLNFFVCLYAFEFTKEVTLMAGLTMFVMGSLGIIVPVQGGTGPWHFMIISTMLLYGIGQTEASTFALVVHAIQQGFVILLGLYAIAAITLANRLRKKVQLTV